jgi:chromate transporter
VLYYFFQKYKKSVYIFEVLNGLKAASLGLIVSASATILLLTFTGTTKISMTVNIDWVSVLVFSCSFLILRKCKVNPIFLMIITGIIGSIVYC